MILKFCIVYPQKLHKAVPIFRNWFKQPYSHYNGFALPHIIIPLSANFPFTCQLFIPTSNSSMLIIPFTKVFMIMSSRSQLCLYSWIHFLINAYNANTSDFCYISVEYIWKLCLGSTLAKGIKPSECPANDLDESKKRNKKSMYKFSTTTGSTHQLLHHPSGGI